MPATSSDTDGLVLIFCALMVGGSLLIDVFFPQKASGANWDNSRPASQRDVADVVKYRTPRSSGPRALPLVILLGVVFAFVLAFGGKTPGF